MVNATRGFVLFNILLALEKKYIKVICYGNTSVEEETTAPSFCCSDIRGKSVFYVGVCVS